MPTNEKSVKDSFGGVGTSFSAESVASDVVEKDKSENAEVSSKEKLRVRKFRQRRDSFHKEHRLCFKSKTYKEKPIAKRTRVRFDCKNQKPADNHSKIHH